MRYIFFRRGRSLVHAAVIDGNRKTIIDFRPLLCHTVLQIRYTSHYHWFRVEYRILS